ncbi:MAG: phosphoribosylglycinamide formyltransferase [Candidatus Omnitrophica bacterium]|nr:phosphoribosylglycinamide formyltransferase [Candidatus Omnitrophota bacterium]
MKRLAIFVSGRGTNMDNIIRCVKKRKIKADVALVFSDVQKAPALINAKRYGIDTVFVNPKKYKDKKAFEITIIQKLRKRCVDFIVLAGYMRILSPYIIKSYKNKILNVHPALLPSFRGANGIKDAYDYGVKVTGVTVHFVTEELDDGPIIIQKAFSVKEGESIASVEKRIHELEYELYPQAINLVLKNKLIIKGRKVYTKK